MRLHTLRIRVRTGRTVNFERPIINLSHIIRRITRSTTRVRFQGTRLSQGVNVNIRTRISTVHLYGQRLTTRGRIDRHVTKLSQNVRHLRHLGIVAMIVPPRTRLAMRILSLTMVHISRLTLVYHSSPINLTSPARPRHTPPLHSTPSDQKQLSNALPTIDQPYMVVSNL